MAQRATVSTIVKAPLSSVYGVVAAIEKYVSWNADLKHIAVLERDADGRPLEVEFRAAAFGRSTTYTLRYDYSQAPETLSWHQIAGDLTESMTGKYSFQAMGEQTKVTYDLEVELRVPIPAFIKARAAHRIQTQALDELKAQAESI